VLSDEASLSTNEVLVISFPSAIETVNRSVLERKSFLKESDDISLASKSSRIHLLQLALFGQSCSANEVVQAQLGLLRNWPSQIAFSILAEIVFGLVSCYQSDNCAGYWDFKVIQELVDVWLSISAANGHCRFSLNDRYRLGTYFGRLISSILSSKTVEATYLATQLVQKAGDVIVERLIEASNLSNGLGDSNCIDTMRENDAVLRSLLEYDPLRFAPCFLDMFSNQQFLRSEHWMQGLFDQASEALIVHPALNGFTRESLTSFGSAIRF